MTTHRWGDESFDWTGLEAAVRYIGLRLRFYRVNVTQFKEKFGEVRVYCHMGWHQVHDITHPGDPYCRYPEWLWRLDCRWGRLLVRPMNWLVVPFQKWIYRQTYKRAVKKWPHLHDEILDAADWDELLTGL